METLDSAKLGAELLRKWELPERIFQMVEMQEEPEYTSPEFVAAEFRRELGVLHLAHVLESLILSETPRLRIYTKDYMSAMGITGTTPEEFLKHRIIPTLSRNRRRLPQRVQALVRPALRTAEPK